MAKSRPDDDKRAPRAARENREPDCNNRDDRRRVLPATAVADRLCRLCRNRPRPEWAKANGRRQPAGRDYYQPAGRDYYQPAGRDYYQPAGRDYYQPAGRDYYQPADA